MFVFITILVVNFLLINGQSVPEERCKTFTNETGSCIPVKNCSIFRKLFEHALSTKRNFTDRELDYFRKSHCGSVDDEHLVCCSDRHNEITRIVPKSTTGFFYTSNSATTNRIVNVSIRNNENIEQHPNVGLLPEFSNCGNIFDLSSDKISLGNVSQLMEFPWMALLQYRTFDNELKFQCAGTLISKKYVLTAAHCVHNRRNELVSVRLGENFIQSEKDCEEADTGEIVCAPPVQDIGIEEIIAHPDFSQANDIALLRLKFNANINNENIIPICLPIANPLQNPKNKKLEVAGWGLNEKGESFEKLYKAILSVGTINMCENVYKRSFTKDQLCAYGKNGVDTCKGDSGGPGMFRMRVGFMIRTVQYGIVSGGNNKCDDLESFPGILTNVPSFMPWILNNLRA